jgi:hypothetical protein
MPEALTEHAPTGDRHPPLLVFIHVPKTAGTNLTNVLSTNEPGDRTQHAGNVFKGAGGLKRGVTFARLRERAGPQLEGVRAVAGHFPLGMREYLPKDRDLRCFTLLREPVDRILSHYFRLRGREENKRGKYASSPSPPDPTLDDLLEGGYIHDNLQTRMLSGLAEPFEEVDEEMLERAKRNLREELVFFGLTERFDESLVLAKWRLGLGAILSRSDWRVDPTRPRGDAVPRKLVEAAERCNRYDIELYRYAVELYERAPELGELEFQVELAALRAAKADGEIDVDVPAPAGFAGDEEAWRMLLRARAALLAQAQGIAEIKTQMIDQLQRLNDAHDRVAETGIPTRGRRRPRRSGRPSSA